MRRHAKASSAGSTSGTGKSRALTVRSLATRGASSEANGSGARSGGLRLALLALTAAAFLLIPAGSAFAGPVSITLTGAGSGTVTSDNGTPPLNCTISGGVMSGVCNTNVVDDFSFIPTTLTATASPGFAFGGWTTDVGSSPAHDCVDTTSPCQLILTTFFESYSLTASFLPPPPLPPTTTDPASAGVNDALMTLNGRVNPNGNELTECYFEYGLTSEYGQTTPCDQSVGSIGSGSAEVPVTASTEELDPGAIYHFRLFASNLGGTAKGKDRTFTVAPAPADPCPNASIRAEQGGKALHLPDCMAVEMVSPPMKEQQFARAPWGVSLGNDRILFDSISSLGDTPSRLNAFGDQYVATRGASGWVTSSTTPRSGVFFPLGGAEASGYTADFSSWFHIGARADEQAEGVSQAYTAGISGAFSPISPLLRPLGPSGKGGTAKIRGASADQSHLYLVTGIQDEPRDVYYLPGDPQPTSPGDRNVYVAALDSGGQPSLELLTRDLDGKAWGGNCGSRLGGMEATSGSFILANGLRNQGAVSADGSQVYFSTRPAQPPTGACGATLKMRIMKRVETPAGPVITELLSSECDRVSPACSSTDGHDFFQGASVDQTKVYFTTTRQLTDTDLDGTSASCLPVGEGFSPVAGCDLYLFDSTKPVGQRLTQVSAGEDATPGEGANVPNGVAAISADGSHVYFAAGGVLTTDPNPEGKVAVAGKPNFYAWDADTGTTTFIGELSAGASLTENDGAFLGSGLWHDEGGTWVKGAYPVPIMGTDSQGNEVGGDGRMLFFISKAQLVANDTDGIRKDLYRYEANPPALECLSCRPGGPDSAPFAVIKKEGVIPVGSGYLTRSRWVSEDGETVVFATEAPLLPGDVNGRADSYMLRHGQLYRLPGSVDTGLLASKAPVVSADGSTVAYASTARVLPFDGDTVDDVYLVRVDGGYPNPVTPASCIEEACQGAPGAAPGVIPPGSSTFSGRGNVEAGSKPKCPKGKVRKQGKCVKKNKQKKRSHARTAGHSRGGSK